MWVVAKWRVLSHIVACHGLSLTLRLAAILEEIAERGGKLLPPPKERRATGSMVVAPRGGTRRSRSEGKNPRTNTNMEVQIENHRYHIEASGKRKMQWQYRRALMGREPLCLQGMASLVCLRIGIPWPNLTAAFLFGCDPSDARLNVSSAGRTGKPKPITFANH